MRRNRKVKKEDPEAPSDSPPIDLWDDAVKKLIRCAKKRGYAAHDQINALVTSKEVHSEQIEDILVMFSEMGSTSSKRRKPSLRRRRRTKEEPEGEESDGELMEMQRSIRAETKKSELGERTDNPVRMYLPEMSSVERLSGEGEVAIAKRIEAGREAMIAGLCESPLTFQALIILARRSQRRQGVPARHHRPGSHLCGPGRQGRVGHTGRRWRGGARGRSVAVAPDGRTRRDAVWRNARDPAGRAGPTDLSKVSSTWA